MISRINILALYALVYSLSLRSLPLSAMEPAPSRPTLVKIRGGYITSANDTNAHITVRSLERLEGIVQAEHVTITAPENSHEQVVHALTIYARRLTINGQQYASPNSDTYISEWGKLIRMRRNRQVILTLTIRALCREFGRLALAATRLREQRITASQPLLSLSVRRSAPIRLVSSFDNYKL
jgi:hypothetical protein